MHKWDNYLYLFANNNAAVILRLPFKNEVVAFVNYMAVDVQQVSDRANAYLGGITDDKTGFKKEGADALGAITSNVMSFADSINNNTLKSQMRNGSASKLFNEKDENFVSKCNNLNIILTAVIANYGAAVASYLTATQVSDAMALVGSFDELQGKWNALKISKDNAKIEFEVQWIPFMEKSLKFMEGLLPGTITTNFPSFVKDFLKMKKLDKTGVKDQGLHPTIVDSVTGDVLVNIAKMETLNYTGTATQKSQMTGTLGLFKLMKLKIGVWQVMYSCPGYEDQIESYRIERRKVLYPAIKMVRTAL